MSSSAEQLSSSLEIIWVPYERLTPNTWNPNRMSEGMFARERASIREFGFVDPLTVRSLGGADFEIIDGEHRWRAGYAEDIHVFPCIVLDVDDDEARELTIVLNDTRGSMQEDRLSALVKDLASRREASRLTNLLPYDRGRMEQLLERREIDWDELEKKRQKMAQGDEERWVERVFRMPMTSAKVLDQAIMQVREQEEIDQDWRALEYIAADFLS